MNEFCLLHLLYSGQGGLGSYFMNFVRSDVNNRFKHHAFFYGIEPLFDEYRIFCEQMKVPFVSVLRKRKIDIQSYREVARYCKRNHINVVVIHTASLTPAVFFLNRKKCRLVFIDHTSHQFKTFVEKLYTLLGSLRAHHYLYFLAQQRSMIHQYLPWLKLREPLAVKIRKKADETKFYPPETRGSRDAFTIGMSARMVPGKLQDVVIEAVHLIRKQGNSIKLRLAGDGPMREKLQRLCIDMAIDDVVSFMGIIPSERMLDFYHSIDAYVHATVGETICLSILEAQACALPIVASDVAGVSDELLHGENALLFSNTAAGLAEQILKLIKSEQEVKRFGQKSLALAREIKAVPETEILHSFMNPTNNKQRN